MKPSTWGTQIRKLFSAVAMQSSLEKKEKASDIDGALNIDGLAQILLAAC